MSEDDPVPAAARLLRDFVNTREPQVDEESLSSLEQLQEWFAEHQLLPTGARLRSPDLATAISVREGLRTIMLDHAGHRTGPAAMSAYNTALAEVPVRLVYTDGIHRLVPVHDTPLGHALAQLLEAVRACEQDQTWHRLKVCARDSCRWAFYDASRNQARRWCSMAGCGNHVKMKRAYATRRARRQQSAATSPVAPPET
jgi:predicted RNA-binding Zn ribbon-like protein